AVPSFHVLRNRVFHIRSQFACDRLSHPLHTAWHLTASSTELHSSSMASNRVGSIDHPETTRELFCLSSRLCRLDTFVSGLVLSACMLKSSAVLRPAKRRNDIGNRLNRRHPQCNRICHSGTNGITSR